ncbi:acetate--CoA ligase family protein [Nocardiopsis salina]|uniref:acetate--CoA ligase family protein n=1 Tax=Nocardiopsis salina TaxID=245836 RepID=UPI000344A592|nr:acetate--CoA ligase family protein [Nocardiopsis salina]
MSALVNESGPGTGLEPLFSPRGIAVIGASSTPGKLGATMAEALATHAAPVALVNPRGEGMHASVGEAARALEGALDLAVLCVPAGATAESLRSAAESGARAALVCAGGFAEAGEAGSEYQRQTEKVLRETGIRLLGPNTSGFFVPPTGLHASFVPGVADIGAGSVGVVSSSGGVNHSVSFRLRNAGVGVSLGVGLGAGIDVSPPEVVDHLADDPSTSVIALHIETVADGPRMAEALRRASLRKPVVALVVGRNDVSEFARSHTGSLATTWKTSRAVLSQNGAVCVEDETELVDVAATLARGRIPANPDPGVGLITGQAGPGLIMADHLSGAGVATPALADGTTARLTELLPPLTYQKNPVDTGRPGPDFPEVVRAVATDPEVDAVGVYGILEPVVDLPDAVAKGRSAGVPAVIGVDGLSREAFDVVLAGADHDLPVLSGPTALARGLTALVRDSRSQHAMSRPVCSPAPVVVGEGPWDEYRAKQLLRAAGIRVPTSVRAASHEEARAGAERMSGPLAVKLVDGAVLHKTEIGGVHLGISTDTQLREALAALDRAGATEYLIEEMAPDGIDLLVGAHRDPVFGPVGVLGLGGTAAEALRDVSIRSAPIREGTAVTMTDELLGGALLRGWRGGPAVDPDELDHVLAVMTATLESQPHVREMEINPLRLTSEGLVALDAVIVSSGSSAEED